MRLALGFIFLAIFTVGACSGAPSAPGADTGPSTACVEAMRTAAEVDSMRDTLEDLHPVVRACANLAEFRAASDQFPAALDGVPPDVILPNLCRNFAAEIGQTPICREVAA